MKFAFFEKSEGARPPVAVPASSFDKKHQDRVALGENDFAWLLACLKDLHSKRLRTWDKLLERQLLCVEQIAVRGSRLVK